MESMRVFESDECDVGRWKLERQKFSHSPSLPREIIEIILSRLAVKDVLRFRVVCKQWEATISNPAFAEIHLHHNKNPSSRNLVAWDHGPGDNLQLHVGELRNNCIEFVSVIEFMRHCSLILCSCDGLYLKLSPMSVGENGERKPVKFVLWNPSCRTYRKLYCPPSVDVFRIYRPVCAMYYDPLKKDYKIVITDLCHYAVYSCRDNKWGDVKQMKGFLGSHCFDRPVFVNGTIYWLVIEFVDLRDIFKEVICFDCKDESFKRLSLPNCKNCDEEVFQLTSFGGQLCLLITDFHARIKIMKKVSFGDEWMESKEECLCEYRPESYPEPMCQVSENEILLQDIRKRGGEKEMVYMVYDKRKNTLVEIHNDHPPSDFLPPPFAHVENLFLL